jgi:hypothetical protein
MAATYAEFIARYKEFAQVEQPVIEAKLADAQDFLDEAAFSSATLYDRAVYYYAAALLADTAFGSQMGQDAGTSRNRYRDIYREQILPLIRRRGQITGGGLP